MASVNGYGITSEPKRYEKEILESLDTSGRIMIDDTQILGDFSAKGSVCAQESTIKTVEVIGQLELKNCAIRGTTSIVGCLNADKTLFDDELIAESQKITFRSCSIHSIRIKKVEGYTGIQIVDLKNGTQVFGPIIVESGAGEIWLSSDSEIAGQIEGAKICKK